MLAYRRHVGIPPLGPDGRLFVVRRLEVNYRAPARFGDEVEAFVRVAHLGRSSHRYEVRLERLSGGPPGHLADAVLTVVGVERVRGPAPHPHARRDARRDRRLRRALVHPGNTYATSEAVHS